MAHHVHNTWPSMSACLCCWCGDISCGVDGITDKSIQWIHVHCDDFQLSPMKSSTTKKINIKSPSTNHTIYCNRCENTHGKMKLNDIVNNFIILCLIHVCF